MTDAQRIHLMAELWPAACQAQGWKKSDRAMRLRVISEALGRTVDSANEIASNADYDAVKARMRLLADDLNGAIEDGHPEAGERRRLRYAITRFADGYWRKIARDKFQGVDNLDDLTIGQLTQLRNTLNSRKSKKEKVEVPF